MLWNDLLSDFEQITYFKSFPMLQTEGVALLQRLLQEKKNQIWWGIWTRKYLHQYKETGEWNPFTSRASGPQIRQTDYTF